MHVIKSVSLWSVAARAAGATAAEMYDVNEWTLKATFSTLTNVNFSDERIAEIMRDGMRLKKKVQTMVATLGGTPPTHPIARVDLSGLSTIELEEYGRSVSIPIRMTAMNHGDAFSLNEVATYGLKGACAYATHCLQLGFVNEDIMRSIHEIYAKLALDEPDMEGLLETVLRVGRVNGQVLAMLDEAHTTAFGVAEPTPVRLTAVEGKCILVSGHDLKDLYELLKQTEGTGVNVYTHGEMMPAHAYPLLKEFPHLVGNFGTAWQNQKFEFAGFPGPVIVTTNCMLEPRKIYKARVYTMNEVGFDGVKHIGPDRDFSEVIEQAKSMKGFPRTIDPARYHTVGFSHRAVLPLADKVIASIKNGDLSRIFLIGGCDGSQWDRNYFTELAEETPADSMILTLGCAKNRVIHSEKLIGEKLANGLPRVLDMGQCNDSYSAVVVAQELAKALNCSVNELPLSLALSHLEQKAAAVFLTLLSMGVKNIRLGPSLPAYLTPGVLDILVKNFHVMPTVDAKEDLKQMMVGH